MKPVRPSRAWYVIASGSLAIAVACVTFGVATFVSTIRQVQQFQRVAAPGQTEVTFTEPGHYYVYLEGPGMSEAAVGSVSVALLPADGGAQVSLTPNGNVRTSYAMGGHEGRLVGTFDIDRAGTYRLRAGQPSQPSITHVAVGGGLTSGIFIPVILIFTAAPFGLAGLTLLVIALVRRARARRAPLSPYPVGTEAIVGDAASGG
ncbi:MAG TPA: hypothetical protein VF163_04345 [Micromonosporaceae bacterium]